MTKAHTLYELQVKQKRHDEAYHPDIFYKFTPADTMKHFMGHYAKYEGRLINAPAAVFDDVANKTLADTTIISLAAGNLLGMNLDESCRERRGVITDTGIGGYARPADVPQERDAFRQWLVYGMGIGNACIAKALDDHDHMAPSEAKKLMENGVTDITLYAIDAYEGWPHAGSGLVDSVHSRWADIEQNGIL